MAQYDFIIVGGTYALNIASTNTDIFAGGTSGCVLASRLAKSASKPSVLLLEAGDSSISAADLDVTERFKLAFKQDSDLNWNYKTTEQYGRQIDYSSGKVLGGSTGINFCAFIVGSQEDYNEWARIVGDEAFAWMHVKEILDRVARYHMDLDAENNQYVRLPAEGRGSGPLHLTYGEGKSHTIHDSFTAADQVGWPRSTDFNSGDPIGIGISPACFLGGKRLTAASSYLAKPPDNLTVLTNTTIARILPEKLQAISTDGQTFSARKEIILCCGAIKTPQLLMLSGIGDPEELNRHDIPVKHDLSQVGKGLQDHCFSSAGIIVTNHDNKDPDPEVLPGQRVPSMKGWFKLPSLLTSPEFNSLSQTTKDYLQKPSVPNWEIAMAAPLSSTDLNLASDKTRLSAIALIMNPQSRGTVSLKSSNPSDPPIINPNFLTHPFDRKALIEATRELLRYFRAPIFADRTVSYTDWPSDDVQDDEVILEHIQRTLASSWHPCGTIVMGQCVDSDFKLCGVEGVRVVDMSVVPLLPCNHTQSTAYLVGEIAAEKMIKEYGMGLVGE